MDVRTSILERAEGLVGSVLLEADAGTLLLRNDRLLGWKLFDGNGEEVLGLLGPVLALAVAFGGGLC